MHVKDRQKAREVNCHSAGMSKKEGVEWIEGQWQHQPAKIVCKKGTENFDHGVEKTKTDLQVQQVDLPD